MRGWAGAGWDGLLEQIGVEGALRLLQLTLFCRFFPSGCAMSTVEFSRQLAANSRFTASFELLTE